MLTRIPGSRPAFCRAMHAQKLQPLNKLNQQVTDELAGIAGARLSSPVAAERLERVLLTHKSALFPVHDSPREPRAAVTERFNAYTTRQLLLLLVHAPELLRVFAPDADLSTLDPPTLKFLTVLTADSADSFEALYREPATRDVALAHAATVDPALHKEFGLVPTEPAHADTVKRWGASLQGATLNRRRVLLLRHHSHPHTNSFNGVRAARNLDRVAPKAGAGRILGPVIDELDGAVRQVFALKQARATAKELFKGMVNNDRLRALRPGQVFDLPLSSMTSAEHQSYRGRFSGGKLYDVEFVLTQGEAADVRAFNHRDYVQECEALALPQQVRVEQEVRTPERHCGGGRYELRRLYLRAVPSAAKL